MAETEYKDADIYCALYYGIRSGKVSIVKLLIEHWPRPCKNKGQNAISTKVQDILATATEELKLQNVLVSQDMEFFVTKTLTDHRFYDNDKKKSARYQKPNINEVRLRIELIQRCIQLLNDEFSKASDVNNTIIFICKSLSKNIDILKRQLRCTYNQIPWEEMMFIVICFVKAHTKDQKANLFYLTIVTKETMLSYLSDFSSKLRQLSSDIENFSAGFYGLPKMYRTNGIKTIIKHTPRLKEMYDNFDLLRDIYSLDKIMDSIDLVLSIRANDKNAQLITTRAFQIMGEYMKNTWESPNLSARTIAELQLSIPENTKTIVTQLRNAYSHGGSLLRRALAEHKFSVQNIQKDFRKIKESILNIKKKRQFYIFTMILSKLNEATSKEEIVDRCKALKYVEMDKSLTFDPEQNNEPNDSELTSLITELGVKTAKLGPEERGLFDFINTIFPEAEKAIQLTNSIYKSTVFHLNSIYMTVGHDQSDIEKLIKYKASETLNKIRFNEETDGSQKIVVSTQKLYLDLKKYQMKLTQNREFGQRDNSDDILRIVYKILFITIIDRTNIKWIKNLIYDLSNADNDNEIEEVTSGHRDETDRMWNILFEKHSQLKITIDKLVQDRDKPTQRNDRLLSTMEMLLIDIMSVLEGFDNIILTKNVFYLDNHYPVLLARELRNHLAHGNVLVEALFKDPDGSTLANAVAFSAAIENGKIGAKSQKLRIGMPQHEDMDKTCKRFEANVLKLSIQDRLFLALTAGNLKDAKLHCKDGAEIFGKNSRLQTALHFASQSGDLNVVTFALESGVDPKAKDIDEYTALHTAAMNGHANIVDYYLKKQLMNVNDIGKPLRTNLQLAAQNGSVETIKVLLEHGSSTQAGIDQVTPISLAVKFNKKDVVEYFLESKIYDVAVSETSDMSLLLLAARAGFKDIVEILIRKGACIHDKSDMGLTALHWAALADDDPTDVAKILIENGAEINAITLADGFTPLLYAIEQKHEQLAIFLLNSGADPHHVSKARGKTPLYNAVRFGCLNVVKALLNKKVRVL